MASEVADLFIKLGLVSAEFTDGLAKAGAEAEGFSAKTDKIGENLIKAGKVVSAVGVGIAAVSVKMAGDWQASMIKLVTSAGETGAVVNGKLTGPIKQVSDGLLKMAVQTGTSTKALADAMYYVESAGFHGANGLKVMKIAAEGARAEGANVTTVADALTTALHDMGKGADYSVPMMNMMIRAVASGKMSMEDFSASLSAMLPQAAAAGISFADVAAAEATLTVAGNTAQNSAQMLGHTIASLQSPNAIAVKAMATFGLSTMDLKEHLGQRGLLGTMAEVDQAIINHLGPDGTYLQSTFNQSKVASQDLNTMLQKMAPQVRHLADEVVNGTIASKDYSEAIRLLPPNLQAQGSEFLTLYKNANSFNNSLRQGVPGADTFAGALRKVLGDTVDTNTALQIGGANLATFAANEKDISEGAKNAGSDIETWGVITQGFNFKIDQARQFIETTAIKLGTMLLPKLMQFMDYVQRTAGPLLHTMGTDIKNALDSDTIHEAEAVVIQFFQNFGRTLKDVWVSVQNLWQAIQPVAALLAGAFFLALKAVGNIMADVVGPAIETVTGFLKDHSGTIRVLAEVILPALLGRLLILKSMDVFTSLIKGFDALLIGATNFGKAVASGSMFDTIKAKAATAAGAVKDLATQEVAAGDAAAGASGLSGMGGFVGKLGQALPIIGTAVLGVSMLSDMFDSSSQKAREASVSMDQYTSAAKNVANGASIQVPAMQHIVDVMRDTNGELKKMEEMPSLDKNKIFGASVTIDIANDLKKLRDEIPPTMDSFAQYGAVLGKLNQAHNIGQEELKNYDAAFAQLVTSGHSQYAAQEMQKIADIVDAQGNKVINTAKDFPQYTQAVADATNKLDLAKIPMDSATDSLNTQSSAATGTMTAMDGLAQSISDATAKQQDMSAGLNADRSLDQFKKSIGDVTQALKDNGTAITGDSDAAMKNRDAIRNSVQAIIDNYNANIQNNMTTDQATQKMKDQITQLENQSGQSDATRKAIKNYIDTLNLIPTSSNTDINVNTSNAANSVLNLTGKLRQLLDMENSAGATPAGSNPGGGGSGGHIKAYAMGGFVDGPTGSPQLAIVHGGEYVVSLDEQRGFGASPGGSGNLNLGGGPTIVINVQGSVISERDLRDLIQTQMLQLGARYSTSYTPYKR